MHLSFRARACASMALRRAHAHVHRVRDTSRVVAVAALAAGTRARAACAAAVGVSRKWTVGRRVNWGESVRARACGGGGVCGWVWGGGAKEVRWPRQIMQRWASVRERLDSLLFRCERRRRQAARTTPGERATTWLRAAGLSQGRRFVFRGLLSCRRAASAPPASCRPWTDLDLLLRLATFRAVLGAKPAVCSAAACRAGAGTT